MTTTALMDVAWLRRLDVHLRAYETTGEPLPLVSLREEIDWAKFVCGIGPDPRSAAMNQKEGPTDGR